MLNLGSLFSVRSKKCFRDSLFWNESVLWNARPEINFRLDRIAKFWKTRTALCVFFSLCCILRNYYFSSRWLHPEINISNFSVCTVYYYFLLVYYECGPVFGSSFEKFQRVWLLVWAGSPWFSLNHYCVILFYWWKKRKSTFSCAITFRASYINKSQLRLWSWFLTCQCQPLRERELTLDDTTSPQ